MVLDARKRGPRRSLEQTAHSLSFRPIGAHARHLLNTRSVFSRPGAQHQLTCREALLDWPFQPLNRVQPVEPMVTASPLPTPPAAAPLVPAVARAVAVMDLLARERQPMSMARVAARLALPKSSVHGLCNTLLSFGYLRRADDGALQIGPGVMSLAEAFVANTSVAGEFDALWRGSAAPDETLILSVLNGTEVVYVAVRNGARPLGLAFTIGMRLPAHLAATGKAMLAHLPPAQLHALYPPDAPLARLTGRGPATLADLMDELQQCRQAGYSVDDEGIREGVVALASPIFDASGQPVAGLGVCLNKAVLNAELQERQRQVVVQAARTLSQRLGARQAQPGSGAHR
jgi:DNA-binding IclR family transcriptional regulator